MKFIKITLPIFIIAILISSCGVNLSHVKNYNSNATQVHLAKNNFKVVGVVKGSAEVSYTLIFGGASKKQLFNDAYTEMLSHANLEDGSRALVNVLKEEHLGGVPPFYYTRYVTVSAHVIEFTD